MEISEQIRYIGAEDKDLDLFESHYQVQEGISYNSYLILDEKTVVMDTIDRRKTEEWLNNLTRELQGRKPDYLVISHMEPDHSANIRLLMERFPEMTVVGNARTMTMLPLYFDIPLEGRTLTVGEGDTLNIGTHTLQFFLAPMVHWPEVMVTYEQHEKVLFSADAFGTFGSIESQNDWAGEARRYYINICGKYGAQVQALLRKAEALELNTICPLHGPVLKGDLQRYLKLYDTWSRYVPEEKGVLIACASIHGHTAQAALRLKEILKSRGAKVELADLTRGDLSLAVSRAFQYSCVVLAACTYDGNIFPPMAEFISTLKAKNFQQRRVGLMENGSWAPVAAKRMQSELEGQKGLTFMPTTVTLRGAMKPGNEAQMQALADELLAD